MGQPRVVRLGRIWLGALQMSFSKGSVTIVGGWLAEGGGLNSGRVNQVVALVQRRGREMPTKPAKQGAHLEPGTVFKKNHMPGCIFMNSKSFDKWFLCHILIIQSKCFSSSGTHGWWQWRRQSVCGCLSGCTHVWHSKAGV